MILYLIAFVVLLLVFLATIGIALLYFGIFDRVEVSTGSSPFPFAGAEIAYKTAKGSPGDSGALFTEVCSIVPGKTTVGLFLELEAPEPEDPLKERATRCTTFSAKFNPSTDECHFVVGVITRDGDQQSCVTDGDRHLLIEKGFKFTSLPASENVVFCKFPYRGIVSVVVGIRRVYPALLQYISDHRLCAYPCMEIYDRDTIYYVLPLSQQSQFVALFQSQAIPVDVDSSSDDTEIENEELDNDDHQSSTEVTNSSFEALSDEEL